ncbi:hypothetical protein D9M71_763250 [compost metagenome]
MMQCFSAPTFFVGAVLEQTFEIYDRPGLAAVHFDLDDKLISARDSRTGLYPSWHVGLQICLQIFLVCRFQHQARSRFGNEEELQGCEDRDV